MLATGCDLEKPPPFALPLSPSKSGFWILFGALTALYAALVSAQIDRPLWFDELLTLHIAQAPTLARLLYLVERWDLNPPVLHLLAHLSLAWTGGIPLAVRFPSIVEFYLASMLLWWFSARKVRPAFAALPVLILWYSPMFRYATEARPYALLCFWFCALLLLWDYAIKRQYRGLILAGIAICSAGLLGSHVFAPLSLLPFFAAEVSRFFDRRKPDFPLWTALFLPLLLTVLYIPFVESYRSITDYPVAFQAGFGKLLSFYWHTLLDVIGCIAVAGAGAWIASKGSWTWKGSVLNRSEWVLFVTLAAVPVLLDFALFSEHAPFWGRYCITSVVAIYFLCSLTIAGFEKRRTRWDYLAVTALLALLTVQKVVVPLSRKLVQPPAVNVAAFARIEPGLPLVAASGLTFVEMGQYESPALLSRLFYLLDRSAGIQFAHATIFEDLAGFGKEFQLPGTVIQYRRFVADHHDFLVFGTFNYPEDWLLRKLAADGARIVPLGVFATPYKDKALYRVHLAGNAQSSSF